MALLIIGSDRANDFAKQARTEAPDRDVRLWPNIGDAQDITAALSWGPKPGELAKLPNLELIVSVGAGVDHLFRDPQLPDAPTIVRYVDPDLTGRMTEYVVLHTLMHSRRMLEFRDLQAARIWRYLAEPAADDVRVGIMGLGVLGVAAANALRALGFQVSGWSRSQKMIDGITCFAGPDSLDAFLEQTDILVVLLPLTPDTHGIVNGSLLSKLSRRDRHPRVPGPSLINAGRGQLQVETDILDALADRTLHSASLDVFETEPLPKTSALWEHPRVCVTPHNAAESTTESIVSYFLSTVGDLEAGRPLSNIVDRSRQY
ncbi:MAG: glyoxylate/hydroxypyruvate reductase A [Pseudomonadota bacterium]